MLLLGDHRQRVEQHEARKMRRRAGQRAAAELGEDMLAWVRASRHHPVGRLRAAVVAHHRMRRMLARKKIGDRALARVAKAEIDGEKCLLHWCDPLWYFTFSVSRFSPGRAKNETQRTKDANYVSPSPNSHPRSTAVRHPGSTSRWWPAAYRRRRAQ